MNIFNKIYWAVYRLTPSGKKAWKFKKGFEGLLISKRQKNATKKNVISSALKILKPKKILAFNKGKAVVKPKKSDHQVKESVKVKHKAELKERGLKINKRGQFKHA